MNCPYCSHSKTDVLDSRIAGDKEAVRRRRQCKKCKKRFTTYERVEVLDIKVIKKDGTIQPFSYEKLFKGIMAACEKTKVTSAQIEVLVEDIEQELRKKEKTDIKSTEIGEMVMKRLRKIDKVAYVRFASVYHEFEDISEFTKQLKELKK
ncbi:MAG: transcriptional regulator NrdR [Candidatus Micrarchaeota archaeon]|nr:transcriptional regulator NrdR [Candidatus Micrarchaeota archaeon]